MEQIPPQNIEAEIAVLGSMLISEDAIAQTIETLAPNYFYKDVHRKIFETIVELYDSNSPVDLITLSEELKKKGILEEVGGPAYLALIANSVPSAANVQYYAKMVKEKYILRSLINVSTEIIKRCHQSAEDVDELLDSAEKSIFEIVSHRIEGRVIPIKELIKSSIATIDNLYQRKSQITGIPSGFIEFDSLTAGFQNSDLVIVAGRPSMGKSAFACSIAEHVALDEKLPVAIFSLEMSKENLVHRMLCSHARVNAHKVRSGFLSPEDWTRLTSAAGKLLEAPIFIDDTTGINVLELRAKARRLKAHHDIKLLIVDYLQLMRSLSRAENRQQEISEISRSLKDLARELDIPVIAISQLSRATEQRQNRRPQLSDLRESGAIEQDADVVILLFREEYYYPSEENKGIAEVIIAKQRNGPVGVVKLAFIKEYTRFENLAVMEGNLT
ncbi:MAG: replicative DNA helicase [Candidatus Omnitrophota bacterium]|nr:MAG: replicative DNA helicase [Candidatus Omnitrophota bacterium]